MRVSVGGFTAAVAVVATLAVAGCSPAHYRTKMDQTAARIITDKQVEALGHTEPFTIEPAADTLRKRLLTDQGLPVSGPASFGADRLPRIAHWPEKKTPTVRQTPDGPILVPGPEGETVTLTLLDALQVAARNSRDYQSGKEDVFRTALDYYLESYEFHGQLAGAFASIYTRDQTGSPATGGVVSSGDVSWSKLFENGASFTTGLAVDLAKLLTGDRKSSLGILADATLSIPLLAGSGRFVVTEPMTQAERNMVYALWSFERQKRSLAVRVASDYLSVLQQLDQVKNAEDNYRRLITSARRARSLADAGRLPDIQVDQARQDELRARERWIVAQQSYAQRLDSFNVSLGLPTDANIDLDRGELERLATSAKEHLGESPEMELTRLADEDGTEYAADSPVTLVEPTREGAGPLEMDPEVAVRIAFKERLDLRTAHSQVEDAQRRVVVAADALRAGLDFTASLDAGEGRGLGSADASDAELRLERGFYSAGAVLDLPLERTSQAVSYRESYISLERAVRSAQALEDQVKLEVRSDLRTLLLSRESYKIQAMAVKLAERRVESTKLFWEAGRAEVRDLLEAQEALLSAQNALTAALVGYRVTELELQRDMDVLQVNEKGLWHEYQPTQAAE